MNRFIRATPWLCAFVAACSADVGSSTEPATPASAITEPLHGQAAADVNAEARMVADVMRRGETANLPHHETIEATNAATELQPHVVASKFPQRKYSPELASALRAFHQQHKENAQ